MRVFVAVLVIAIGIWWPVRRVTMWGEALAKKFKEPRLTTVEQFEAEIERAVKRHLGDNAKLVELTKREVPKPEEDE